MGKFLRAHAELLAVFVGILVMGGGLVVIGDVLIKHESHERVLAEKVVVAGELNAEKIVIGSDREGCRRTSSNLVNSLNAWFYVVTADYEAGTNPESAASARQIRLHEAQSIDVEERRIAERVDFHYADGIIAPSWRAAAMRRHTRCDLEYPSP